MTSFVVLTTFPAQTLDFECVESNYLVHFFRRNSAFRLLAFLHRVKTQRNTELLDQLRAPGWSTKFHLII